MTISKEQLTGWDSAVRTAEAMKGQNMAISANLLLDVQDHIEHQAARIAEMEAQMPSALREKLRSAEARIAELEQPRDLDVPAFYVNRNLLDPSTGKLRSGFGDAIEWSNSPVADWTLPVYVGSQRPPAQQGEPVGYAPPNWTLGMPVTIMATRRPGYPVPVYLHPQDHGHGVVYQILAIDGCWEDVSKERFERESLVNHKRILYTAPAQQPVSGADELQRLADQVVLANATSNPDLHHDAVVKLIAGVRNLRQPPEQAIVMTFADSPRNGLPADLRDHLAAASCTVPMLPDTLAKVKSGEFDPVYVCEKLADYATVLETYIKDGASQAAVPEGWRIERTEDGRIIVQKKGVVGYVASEVGKSGVAESALYYLADALLSAQQPECGCCGQPAVCDPDCDAQQPAVPEGWLTRLYNTGYHAGHHHTVEGHYTHVYPVDMDTYHSDLVAEWLADNPDALLSAQQPVRGQAQPLIARPLAEWHEDDGPVAWWAWCGHGWAGESAWCGTPLDSDWPGYHTHWTPHPAMPPAQHQAGAAQASSRVVGREVSTEVCPVCDIAGCKHIRRRAAVSQMLETAPVGTRAPAITGGQWYRTERGWKWNGPDGNGGTFPRPGGDWDGNLWMPEFDEFDAQAADGEGQA